MRFPDILQHRVRRIIGGFDQAREKLGYENGYTLLYPIKVNQQEAVIKSMIADPTLAIGLEAAQARVDGGAGLGAVGRHHCSAMAIKIVNLSAWR